MKPNVIIMSGYGLNCEEETAFAFKRAGANEDIVHINDLIDGRKQFADYQILVFPGGFSFGDDTGSGNAFANKIRNHLWEDIYKFVQEDKLAIGICNGFQVMVNLGLLPATRGLGEREVALTHNTSARYLARWVDLKVENDSPWLKGIDQMSIPIAHGEGNFYAPKNVLTALQKNNQIALTYVYGDMCDYQQLAANPNGSLENIAGITDASGRLLGMMPHPERAIAFTHLPDWTLRKEIYLRNGDALPKEGPGLALFENAVAYFK